MFRLNLGGGAVAFEIEGEADSVASLDPKELVGWPSEVVENLRRYRASAPPEAEFQSSPPTLSSASGE